MSELNAIALARDFSQCDAATFGLAASAVQELIEQGYTPDDALMLCGIAGYND